MIQIFLDSDAKAVNLTGERDELRALLRSLDRQLAAPELTDLVLTYGHVKLIVQTKEADA